MSGGRDERAAEEPSEDEQRPPAGDEVDDVEGERPASQHSGSEEGRDSDHDPRRSPLDASGFERPAFLLDFPMDAKLEPLIAAFENGNYAYVRDYAEAVARGTEDEAVQRAARELVRRTEPDPLAKYLLGLAFALLAFLVLWAYAGHSH